MIECIHTQCIHTHRLFRPIIIPKSKQFFRYLQTNNPIKLEENDLKRALEASLEESPEFWIDDSASSTTDTCSSVASGSCATNGKMFTKTINNTSTNGTDKSIDLPQKKPRKYAQIPYSSPRKSVVGPFKQTNLKQETKIKKRRSSTTNTKSSEVDRNKCSARRIFHLSSTDSCSTSTKSGKKIHKNIPQLYKDVVPETNGFLTLLCLPKQIKSISNPFDIDNGEEAGNETIEQTLDLVIDPEKFNKKLVELSCLNILPPSLCTRQHKNSTFHHSARKKKLIKTTISSNKPTRLNVSETRKLRHPRPNITECIKSEPKQARQTRASANVQIGQVGEKTKVSLCDTDSNIYGCSSIETPESVTSSSSLDALESANKSSHEPVKGVRDLPEHIRRE